MFEEVFFMCQGRIHHHRTSRPKCKYADDIRGEGRGAAKSPEELGNPFQQETADLLVLDTKTIADPTLAGLVGMHQERGKQQFKSFVDGLEIDDTSSF